MGHQAARGVSWWVPVTIAAVAIALGVVGILRSGTELSTDGLPTFGGVELDKDGEIDVDNAPDLIAVAGLGDEVAGYARKADLFPGVQVTDGPHQEPVVPLYDERGEKLVGFLMPDHGVVSVADYNRRDFGTTIPTATTRGG